MERTDLETPGGEHERRDVSVKAIVKFLVWLLVSAAVVQVAMWGLFKLFEAREEPSAPLSSLVAASLKRTPPAPRLETQPLVLKAKLRAQEEARLNAYSWADRPGGVVRIPIERAMDLIVERGVPGGKASAAPPAATLAPTPGAVAP